MLCEMIRRLKKEKENINEEKQFFYPREEKDKNACHPWQPLIKETI